MQTTPQGRQHEDVQAMRYLQAYWAAEADFKKGLAAYNQGKIRQAHAFFTGAVTGAPDELEFRAYHAYTSFSMERAVSQAQAQRHIATLQDVLKRNKAQERQLDTAWALLGRAYREGGKPEQARRCFVQALRIRPSNPDARRELRRIAVARKKAKEKGLFSWFFSGR